MPPTSQTLLEAMKLFTIPNDEATRWDVLKRPIVDAKAADHVIATDGHIILSVPRALLDDDLQFEPANRASFADAIRDTRFDSREEFDTKSIRAKLAPLKLDEQMRETCEFCNGDGELGGVGCDFCDYTGETFKTIKLQIFGGVYQWYFVRTVLDAADLLNAGKFALIRRTDDPKTNAVTVFDLDNGISIAVCGLKMTDQTGRVDYTDVLDPFEQIVLGVTD